MNTANQVNTWYEVIRDKDEMQKIIHLLVSFDEKTGRLQNFTGQDGHYMRKSLSVAHLADIRIFLRNPGGYVYSVIGEISSSAGFLVTNWIHEDGIRVEREDMKNDPEHPVHTIICVTDIYEKNKNELMKESDKMILCSATQELMERGRETGES